MVDGSGWEAGEDLEDEVDIEQAGRPRRRRLRMVVQPRLGVPLEDLRLLHGAWLGVPLQDLPFLRLLHGGGRARQGTRSNQICKWREKIMDLAEKN